VSVDRFVSVQFCDDIRQEVGNKFSLIGCYGDSIQVNPIPSVIPKLCASVKVYTPIGRPFAKLIVRILRGDTPIAEMLFPPEGFAESLRPSRDGAQWLLVYAMFAMTPFQVEAPCSLRVEAETEEGTVSGGTIWIDRPPTAAPTPQLSNASTTNLDTPAALNQ
jgi:hypothetical protein